MAASADFYSLGSQGYTAVQSRRMTAARSAAKVTMRNYFMAAARLKGKAAVSVDITATPQIAKTAARL